MEYFLSRSVFACSSIEAWSRFTSTASSAGGMFMVVFTVVYAWMNNVKPVGKLNTEARNERDNGASGPRACDAA